MNAGAIKEAGVKKAAGSVSDGGRSVRGLREGVGE